MTEMDELPGPGHGDFDLDTLVDILVACSVYCRGTGTDCTLMDRKAWLQLLSLYAQRSLLAVCSAKHQVVTAHSWLSDSHGANHGPTVMVVARFPHAQALP